MQSASKVPTTPATDIERALWVSVYTSNIAPGCDPDAAKYAASEALKAFRDTFGEPASPGMAEALRLVTEQLNRERDIRKIRRELRPVLAPLGFIIERALRPV